MVGWPSPKNVGRLIGAAGSSVPVVGDLGTMAFIKKYSKKPIGIGARQGLKYAGGPIAVASWSYMGYQNRHLPGLWYGKAKQGHGQLMASEFMQPSTLDRVKIGSRGGRGATTLSQRASRSVRPGNRRRRCKSRNKSGKTCLRPRNHSGRHRYR